ncbi:MAG: CpsD/CapB family tyrosine-protein kinase, partial [Cytophagales bacterium]|nr:CpsD/CapB family tyrosine-protein kinase [Cytophagales bacterium]
KTFCAINLGITLAQSRNKVLVLDTDLRKSNLNKYYKSKNNAGLSTYLIGKSGLNDIIINTGINDFYVITSGPFPPNPDELLSLPKMDQLIQDLKNRFDYIIIDSPPIGIVSDYLELIKYTKTTFYIVRQNYTPKDSIEKVEDLVNVSNIKSIKFILNGVKMNSEYGNIHGMNKNKTYYS